ncbi:MAG: DEAD/DEAH box helicase [Armatimonadota bacterium]
MTPFQFLDRIRHSQGYSGQIVHVEDISPRDARYAEPARPLPEALLRSLQEMGVESLYTHQAAALDAVRAGDSVAVVTGTASGKTLCYNLPVLERLLTNHSATALYLYPTKALAQDQLGKLRQFRLPGRVGLCSYDGDTSRDDRAAARRAARLVLSNVDMLHQGILPNHAAWGRFFRRLEFVVVDEMHTYRGVFGSHVGCVLRRLRRICRHYGSRPQFIFTSATIANPQELARGLSGLDVRVIDDDGSPRGPRKFVFWNPPVLGSDGRRRSAHSEATGLFAGLVADGVRNITFTRARRSAELVLRYAREQLEHFDPQLRERVMSYRAGYRPEERREIERRLFEGSLIGVVSTDAMELGVDVGGLDATVLVGYPGTISSAWQQAGRAGRGCEEALSVLVALEDPLDQYLMTHPSYFFEQGHERVLVNPANEYILAPHICCAAFELPATEQDLLDFGENAPDIAWRLCAEGDLGFRGGRFYYLPDDYPAALVGIRSSSSSRFRIVTRSGQELGEVDAEHAFREVHEGAIYLHQGESYRVVSLNLVSREAVVEPGEFHYYTRAAEEVDLRVVEEVESVPLGAATAHFGRVEVTSRVVAYRKIDLYSDSVQAVVDLDLPEQSFLTEGLWFTVPHRLVRRLSDDGFDLMGSIHAIEHAAIGLTPLVASCDRWDVGGISHPYHLDTGGLATVFIYDAYPGGVGIASACYLRLKELLTETLELLRDCPCEEGCPSCIHSPKCGSGNEPLDKAGALRLLGLILSGKRDEGAERD